MTQAIWFVVTVFAVIGFTAGFFMHRSDFCLAGAFRDLFLFRSTNRLGGLVFLVAISAVIFELMRLTGLLATYPFPKFSQPSISNIIGGALFGIGMVLAGGCVVGVLYKFGSGNLLAGVAIIGLIIGSGFYAEIHPFWMSAQQGMGLHVEAVTLPDLLGFETTWVILVAVLLCAFISWQWWLTSRLKVGNQAEGYVPLWITALVLTVLSCASILVTSGPLSIATSYAKAAAVVESLLISDHVQQTAFFVKEKPRFTLPFTDQVLSGGGGPRIDAIAIVQYPLILGLACGSMISARLLGEFKIYWKVPLRQFVMVLFGGIIMALGARMAPGCNLWHLLGGIPILALHSLLFVLGMIPGAWLGTIILKRVLV